MTGWNKKIGGGGFHHIAFRVKDFDASVKFYTEGLGFKKYAAWGTGNDRGALLDTGDGNYFELFAGGSTIENHQSPFMHIALRTEDTDAALKVAVEAGAVVTMEPTDITFEVENPFDVRIAFCKGLDGEEIEFFQYK